MNKQTATTNERNLNGVKDSSNQYRVIKGVVYNCVSFGQINSAEIAQGYKAEGRKVRRIGDDVYVATE
jgi:hypothetical protein